MRKLCALVVATVFLLAAAACARTGNGDGEAEETSSAASAEPASPGKEAVARLEAKSGSEVSGTAVFAADGDLVTLTVQVQGAPPGEHAFHIHEVGDCSADDGTSAGGHWNPTGHDHGKWGTSPFHLGDVGNIEIGSDGSGSYDLTSYDWTIGTGADNDVVGRAVILHAGVDDFTSQPTGAAGGRIACGVIE